MLAPRLVPIITAGGERPTIDLDFVSYFDVAAGQGTFSRASSATYLNSLQVLKTASANTARHGWDEAAA